MTDPIARLNTALSGRYEIERELGEGGMATVYLADDLRHGRKVALKVLKPELAAVVGADRFLAEIKTTANLQHPHILPLFDSGEADTFLFYAMPYIEGETLRDRIDREKQLPLDEALYIATSVANALQTAHDAGVVHRDIKPGNILLARGEPLVADFGIALAVGAAGGNRLTETGLSVGTPYYMSPEQATGDQAVGPASDVFALACVLYEMLTGEPPYPGNTAQAVLGKIIQGVPVSATAARKAVPQHVDAAIRKALEKLPADRFTQAAHFSKALADPSFRHGEVAGFGGAGAGRWKAATAAAGVAAVLAAVAAVAGWSRALEPAPVLRQGIPTPAEGLPRPLASFTALAPDGSSMVYAQGDADSGEWQLWLKPRGSAEPTLLPGTERAQNVTYSPDGLWIAYVTGNELRKRPVGDGSAVTLAEDLPVPAATSQVALAWLDDGTLVYEMPGPLMMRIPDTGGQADTVLDLSTFGYSNFAFAGALPGSRGALVTTCIGACGSSQIVFSVVDFEADTLRVLMNDVVRGWYTPTGDVMYVRADGAVFAAPFDLDALELTGPGIPLFDGVSVTISSPELIVARDGTVIFSRGTVFSEQRELVWVDRTGRSEPVDPAMDEDFYRTASSSPEGDRIAVTIENETAGLGSGPQLWVKQLPNGPITRLTTDAGYTRRPVWAPDGASIAYITNEGGAFHARSIVADGSSDGEFSVLLEKDGGVQEVLFANEGQSLVFREGALEVGEADLGLADLASQTQSTLLASAFNEADITLSADERWLGYVSNASGRAEVIVRPFPETDYQVQVSTSGGQSPVFARSGNELFYIDSELWMVAATYEDDPRFVVVSRERLFEAGPYYREAAGWRAFDVTPDGQRFLMISSGVAQDAAEEDVATIYIQNYFEELKERVER